MSSSKFAVKRPLSTDVHLQIAPVASLFTAILVVLLKTISADSTVTQPSDDLDLPALSAPQDFHEAVKIEVSSNAIRLGNTVITKLQAFEFDPADVGMEGGLKTVNEAIRVEKEKEAAAQIDSQDILIMADQKAPYRTLKRVIASATFHGFQKIKLVVLKANE
jgi:biopolymer transport protein ExbD